MSEEVQPKPSTETPEQQAGAASAAPQTPPGADNPPAAEDVPAWAKALDEAPPEELKKHKRFWGILGSELEERRKAWETSQTARWEAEQKEQERQKAEAEMEALASRDPDAFADRFLRDRVTQKQQKQIAEAGVEQTRLIGRLIGSAVRDLPEWADMTPADHERFFEAVAAAEQKATKSGEDPRAAAISAFNTTVVSRVAELRAAKEHAKWREADLAKEVAAAKAELEMAQVSSGARPEVGRTRGNGAVSDEPDWRTNEAEWNRWYARNRLRGSAKSY